MVMANFKQSPKTYAFEDYPGDKQKSFQPDFTTKEPWHPFNSSAEFEFAELVHEANMNEKHITKLLKLIQKIRSYESVFNFASAQDIKDAFAKAKETFGRIDVVFNNAGWAVAGEIEGHPEKEARRMFDTNFWGAANVSKEAVRFFRDENKPSGGLLLNNSALNGVQAQPGLGYYAASKYGIFIFVVTDVAALTEDPSHSIRRVNSSSRRGTGSSLEYQGGSLRFSGQIIRPQCDFNTDF